MTEDHMFGWHHQLNGHEFEQPLGDSKGQRSLACCSPWGCKELDTTWQLKSKIFDKKLKGWEGENESVQGFYITCNRTEQIIVTCIIMDESHKCNVDLQ